MESNQTTGKHAEVQERYAEAAQKPTAGLCCPKSYDSEMRSHIPTEAFEHNYGCGGPVAKAGLRAGEVVVDLGSGVGIDCFVAARMVGAKGRVIGVDMTDAMLAKANHFRVGVAKNLGYDVLEFRKGIIEDIPVESDSVDVVMSNCVLNLSPDKALVFDEIYRILKPGGRLVISDIVSDREIEKKHRDQKELWTDCYTGALSVGALMKMFEDAGFRGLTQTDESSWKEVAGYNLSSLTLTAYKFADKVKVSAYGEYAIYLGPYASVQDDKGNTYARFSPTLVDENVASMLKLAPFTNSFLVVGRAVLPDPNRVQAKAEVRGGCPTPSTSKAEAKAPAKADAGGCCPGGGGGCGPGGCGPSAESTGTSGGVKAEMKTSAAPDAGRRASPCCNPEDTVKPCCENNQPKEDGSPCCDVYAVQQPPGCGCGTSCGVETASEESSVAISAASLGSDASPQIASGPDCCPCDTEAKATSTPCCGAGCGECGCQ
ncbi:MAG: methyltransferase domain-containing protein [Myxococcota bacterium]